LVPNHPTPPPHPRAQAALLEQSILDECRSLGPERGQFFAEKEVTVASTPLNVGFLTVLQEGGAYLGGYLVTNVWGRPLEFRLSSAVQPNKVQQILYAGTLASYVCGDLIGKALVDKAGVAVQLVVTTCEAALDLRLKLEAPVVWLVLAEGGQSAGPLAVGLPGNRGSLICHARYPGDAETVRGLLATMEGTLDLMEPFARIREAITEARKMGVATRAA
jgi:hypothetical protein